MFVSLSEYTWKLIYRNKCIFKAHGMANLDKIDVPQIITFVASNNKQRSVNVVGPAFFKLAVQRSEMNRECFFLCVFVFSFFSHATLTLVLASHPTPTPLTRTACGS